METSPNSVILKLAKQGILRSSESSRLGKFLASTLPDFATKENLSGLAEGFIAFHLPRSPSFTRSQKSLSEYHMPLSVYLVRYSFTN